VHSTALDSISHHSDKTNKEDKRTWPQIVHGQFHDCNKLDGQERCQHATIHDPPQEGNFRNEEGKVIKPKLWQIITITWVMWIRVTEWLTVTQLAVRHGSGQKKLFFHLLKLAILNSYILLSSFGGKKISHRDSSLALLRNMLELPRQEWHQQRPVGRQSTASVNIGTLDDSFNKYWPGPSKPGRSRACRHGKYV
jgi:hypothetical protein